VVCVGVCTFAVIASIPVRAVVVVAAALFVGVLIITGVLGSVYRTGTDGRVADALSERRLELWHESVQILGDHPLGVGPGRYEDVSPTARRDADARWAHNEFLQQGVELGWIGLVLTALFFLWGFARLWVRPAPDVVTALGAASLAALGIHGCVDYIIHFPAVPLAAAVIVGNAQAVPFRRHRRDHAGDREEGIEDGDDAAGMASAQTAG
jgi:O-antigen ligase